MSKTIYIGGRLESKEKGNVVTGANAILDDTKGKKQNVINKETDDELLRLEQSKQDNLTFDNTPTEDSTNPVTSGGVYTAEKALSDAIEAILLLIPSAATELNKLVDTNTMNSSISTATATFRGTYNAVSDLGLTYQATHAQIEAALDTLGLTADNNDFAFVQIPVSDQSQDIAKTERFKFNGTNWLYEYDLNTSGFTASQWAAINSGITVALVTKLTDLPTAAALQLALNAKQDTLTFDNEPTALSQNPVTSGGIYTAIQAVATALSNYSDTTDNRLNTLEGLVPTEASSSNKLTDKAYVDGLIQAITELIPAEADTTNQLADKAYVLAQILAATPAFKGQFTTLAELQAVVSPKDGDLGIVRTKDSDGMDVFTVYQYLNNAWNVFYSLSYHPQTKPATTGTTGDYPYNGMGRVELAKNMVNTGTELAPVMVNQLTQDMFYKGEVGSRVPNTNTIFVIRYDYVLAENITIPDGCVLEFEGGSITGGTINISNASNVSIIGNGVLLTGTIMFSINDSQNIRITDLSFIDYSGCIGINDSKNIIIDKCRFENSQSTAIFPHRSHGKECKNIKITNCTFKNVSATNEWGGAIYIDGQGKNGASDTVETLPIEDIIIDGNSFENIGCAGINLGGAKNVTISNNILQKASYDHSMLMTTSRETTKVVITGNFFKGCGYECCVINYSSDCVVTGNYFEEFGIGVCVEAATQNVTVTGNTFRGLKDIKIYNHRNNLTQAVVLSACTHITISSNNIEDCTNGVTIVEGNFHNIIGNNIEANLGIVEESSYIFNNCSIKDNLIQCDSQGIRVACGTFVSIDNNTIISNNTTDSYGLKLLGLNTGHLVSVKTNKIKAAIGFDFSALYNPAGGKIVIIDNEIESSVTPLKKLYFNNSCGTIYWDNPLITLSPVNVVQIYDVNSVIHYDHTTFNTTDGLPDGSASLAYYMNLAPKGTTFVMSDRSVVQITGGGGSTHVTTRELVAPLP